MVTLQGGKKMRHFTFSLAAAALLALSGCASTKIKEKRAERDKLAQQSGIYCDFVNAEEVYDTDVELSIEMAKRCQSDKPYSISAFRTVSEHRGMIYCCSPKPFDPSKAATPAKPEANKSEPKLEAKPEAKSEAKLDGKLDAKPDAKPDAKGDSKAKPDGKAEKADSAAQ